MKKATVFLIAIALLIGTPVASFAKNITCWFPPGWSGNGKKVFSITKALSKESGLKITPRIAKSYPEILKAFDSKDYNLVYVGSFVQAIINAKGLGTALVQNIDGKDLYSGVMVYPKGGDPEAILENHPKEIAFAKGASSGESSAKAATGGQAAIAVANHGATCKEILEGRAKAGFVKNWWWEKHKLVYKSLAMHRITGISIEGNPDNVLTASKSMPADMVKKITDAAIAVKDVFDAPKMVAFDKSRLAFPLELMKKGKIDPLTYKW